MLTLEICVGVFSGIFKARIMKLGIHMDNELLYYGIENRTLCFYSTLDLSIFYTVFFVFVFRLFRIRVTVFFATYLLLLLYSSALLKQRSGAIVRFSDSSSFEHISGWSGGAKALGKLSVPGRPTYLDYGRARAYCACSRCGWGLFGHFFSRLSVLSPSLWETARYRLKYCLKGPLSKKQLEQIRKVPRI